MYNCKSLRNLISADDLNVRLSVAEKKEFGRRGAMKAAETKRRKKILLRALREMNEFSPIFEAAAVDFLRSTNVYVVKRKKGFGNAPTIKNPNLWKLIVRKIFFENWNEDNNDKNE